MNNILSSRVTKIGVFVITMVAIIIGAITVIKYQHNIHNYYRTYHNYRYEPNNWNSRDDVLRKVDEYCSSDYKQQIDYIFTEVESKMDNVDNVNKLLKDKGKTNADELLGISSEKHKNFEYYIALYDDNVVASSKVLTQSELYDNVGFDKPYMFNENGNIPQDFLSKMYKDDTLQQIQNSMIEYNQDEYMIEHNQDEIFRWDIYVVPDEETIQVFDDVNKAIDINNIQITMVLIIIGVVIISGLIYFIVYGGKTSEGEVIKLTSYDEVYFEIKTLILAGFSFISVLLILVYYDRQDIMGHIESDELLKESIGVSAEQLITAMLLLSVIFTGAMLIRYLVSINKHIINKTFWKNNIIYAVYSRTIGMAIDKTTELSKKAIDSNQGNGKKLIKKSKDLAQKSKKIVQEYKLFTNKNDRVKNLSIAIILALFATGMFIVFTMNQYFWFGRFIYGMISLIALFVIGYAIIHLLKSFVVITDSIEKLKNGENITQENIDNAFPYVDEVRTLSDIEKIANKHAEQSIRAERTKAELITNVSHDLRTPLTSIVAFSDLLDKKKDVYDEETKEYIKAIKEKSERMSLMVEDLFDLSKSSTGGVTANPEVLNVKNLVKQVIYEQDFDGENNLYINIDEKINIYADSNHMYRIMQNIIQNAIKYHMYGTRIYIDSYEIDDKINIEVKNIASYHMNFGSDEIATRFARGDESRTEEGNGLGLAIIKSYTELNKGTMDLTVDGDLFKIIIIFPKNNKIDVEAVNNNIKNTNIEVI